MALEYNRNLAFEANHDNILLEEVPSQHKIF